MQISTFRPIRFSSQNEPPKAPGEKKRFIIVLKDEALDSFASKAAPELEGGLKNVGFKNKVIKGLRGVLKILVGSRDAATTLKTDLKNTPVPGLEVNDSGSFSFKTTLPPQHENITKYGFPNPFPLPVVFADEQKNDVIYRG
jgi:hypothetical protein